MDKAFKKKMILVGLRVAREMALQAWESYCGPGVPQVVHDAVKKTVDAILEAEEATLAWHPEE